MIDRLIEGAIVAALFDNDASVVDRSAVACKQTSGFGFGQTAGDMRQVHRDLPCERDAGAATVGLPQLCLVHVETTDNGHVEKLAEFRISQG